MPEIILRFAKLSENATAPSKGSKYAAGYDLYSAYDYEVPAAGKVIVKTDIQIQLPEGCYGRVAPRSGLAANHHIDIGAGVIDQDYRGNVGVVMFNHSQTVFKVNKGDRVAQLICECILYPEIQEAKIPLKEVMEDSAQPVRTDTLYSAERNLSVKQRLAGLELLPVYNHVLVDTLVRCLRRNP